MEARSSRIGLAGFKRCGASQRLWRPYLPLAVFRYQQESHPAMVRHEDLRQPDEGATPPGPLSECMNLTPLWVTEVKWVALWILLGRSKSPRNGTGSPNK